MASTTNPHVSTAALAPLVCDLYATTEWRRGTDDSTVEPASLHHVLLAVGAHGRRMSSTYLARAYLKGGNGHD